MAAPASGAAVRALRWLSALFSREFLARLCAEAALPAVALSGRRGGEYDIFVVAANVVFMQREGELAICLAKRPAGQRILPAVAMLRARRRRTGVVIGGLQGPASAYKRDVIEATRDLYGLRPKDAALLAARALAQALGFNALHAICDANHVLRRLQDKTKFSHYDDYWSERGGKRGGPFGFVFGPLEASAPTGDRRDATKAAIVAGMEAFVAAHRAPQRPPIGGDSAQGRRRDPTIVQPVSGNSRRARRAASAPDESGRA